MPLARVRLLSVVRSALFFDGLDDRVEVSDDPTLDITDAITIECLLMCPRTGFNITTRPVEKSGSYSLALGWNEVVVFEVFIGGTLYSLSSYTNLVANVWSHVVGRYDSATHIMDIFIDSELKNTRELTGLTDYKIDITTSPIIIPGGYANGRQHYIAFIRIYNRALSDSEISWNYRHPDAPVKSGLALWLHNTSIEDSIWRDLSDNNNDGTIYGATKVDFVYTPVRIRDSIREQSVIR